MNLEKAVKELKDLREIIQTALWRTHEQIEAIDTVLTALDERYNKGYQDGFCRANALYKTENTATENLRIYEKEKLRR